MGKAPSVTKAALINGIAHHTGRSEVDVREVVEELISRMAKVLREGRRIEIRDFLVIEPFRRAAREIVLPNGKLHRAPARRDYRLKPSKLLLKR